MSPLLCGDADTRLVTGGDADMLCPLSSKEVDPSHPGVSDNAIDVDSAEALERYVPDWSVTNKDRIADALLAKMSLFHIGTPAKHFHYRKMSGSELGNALMFNQA
ncbi:hypothetical protein Hanom_Chr05g00423451 [Helianthus anomalus]